MDLISSTQNDTVKLVRSLAHKKQRSETDLFAAEGRDVLARARALGWAPHTLILRQGSASGDLAAWCNLAGGRCLAATDQVMAAVSAQGNSADCLALFTQRWQTDQPRPSGDALWLALENIRDPGNLGTIIRTADAVSAAGIILAGNCCDPYANDCVRATMGSIFALPLLKLSTEPFIALMKDWPGEAVGTAAGAALDYRRDYRTPTLLVMGSEGEGLSAAVAMACGNLVRIPMSGGTESLNVAIATALMLYEIRKPELV